MNTLKMITLAASTLIASASYATAPARIHAFESDGNGFNTKNFFYDNGEEVVVFDTQFTPDLARKSIEFIRGKTSNPITTVVITHPNPDKFNGMSVFQELGAKVIASSRTAASLADVHAYKKYYFVNIAKMFTEETYPRLGSVDQTFEDKLDLHLRNGETISLTELGRAGVSGNQTVAYIQHANALIVGDLVHNGAHAWLEGGIVGGKPVPTLDGWIADLNELANLAPVTAQVYGGRGNSAPLPQAMADQIAYLHKADAIVTDYVAQLGSRKSELLGNEAGQHYLALQKKFEEAFPTYSLGYMIQYGVYGLVNSKL